MIVEEIKTEKALVKINDSCCVSPEEAREIIRKLSYDIQMAFMRKEERK